MISSKLAILILAIKDQEVLVTTLMPWTGSKPARRTTILILAIEDQKVLVTILMP